MDGCILTDHFGYSGHVSCSLSIGGFDTYGQAAKAATCRRPCLGQQGTCGPMTQGCSDPKSALSRGSVSGRQGGSILYHPHIEGGRATRRDGVAGALADGSLWRGAAAAFVDVR